jgi:hypothetical protein
VHVARTCKIHSVADGLVYSYGFATAYPLVVPLDALGRLLLFAGIGLALLGLLLLLAGRIPFLGRLPGDFSFGNGNVHVYIPLATGILLSLVLTLVLNLLARR